MRMEKGFFHWKADLLTEFDPFETGLDRFVKLSKGDFVGKAALETLVANGPGKKMVTLEVGTTRAPAPGGASLMLNNKVVGTVTSGDWGHRVGLNLAYAFVDAGLEETGTRMQLDLCGELIDATVIPASPYDPDFARLRS